MTGAGSIDCHGRSRDLDRVRTAIRAVVHSARVQRLPSRIARIKAASAKVAYVADNLYDVVEPVLEVVPVDSAAQVRLAIRKIRQVSLSSWYVRRIKEAYGREYTTSHRAQMLALKDGFYGAGLPVAILSVCGRGTAEIRFTQLLKHFLDPLQCHGLGHLLLHAGFGPEVFGDDTPRKDLWQNAEVRAEVDLGITLRPGEKKHSNHLDILVVAGDVAVLLEQKIRSSENVATSGPEAEAQEKKEQIRQLAEYSQAFSASRPDLAPDAKRVFKIYLTPDGRAAPNSPEWTPLSHAALIRRFLSVDTSSISPVARHNLVTFLWDLACGPLELNDALKGAVPELKQAVDAVDEGRLGPYLSWRRWYSGSLPLLMEILQLL